jgi:hypothetical protein
MLSSRSQRLPSSLPFSGELIAREAAESIRLVPALLVLSGEYSAAAAWLRLARVVTSGQGT